MAGNYYSKNIFMWVIKYCEWACLRDYISVATTLFYKIFIHDKNLLYGNSLMSQEKQVVESD